MLIRESLASLVTWKPIFLDDLSSTFTLLLMPLAGCSGEGAGGPTISSLSKPTNATAGLDSDPALTPRSKIPLEKKTRSLP